ncbi:Protein AHNAK2, partial [Tinamus guttatus]
PKLDVSLPSMEVTMPKIEMEIQHSNLECELEQVVADDNHLSSSEIKMTTTEGSLELKSPETTVERTSHEIVVDTVEIKHEGPEGKTKMYTFQMPKSGITYLKGKVPEKEVIQSKSDISVPHTSKIDVYVPSGDISFPKTGSDIQDSDTASKVKGEIKHGDVDGEEKEGHFKMPKFKLPSFSRSPKKEACIKSDSGAHLEDHQLPAVSGRIDTEVTGTATDDQGPTTALDLEISAGKGEQKSLVKKAQFVMPKISLSKIKIPKSQVNLPKVEADATIPKVEGDGIKFPKGEVSIELKSPETGSEGSSIVDERKMKPEGAEGKIKIPKIQKPKFGISLKKVKGTEPEISSPKAEAELPQLQMTTEIADMDLGVPASEFESDISDPGIQEKDIKLKDQEIKAQAIQTEEHQGWFKMPKFRIPSFGRTSLKEKKGDADVEGTTEITAGKEDLLKLGEYVKSSDVSLSKMEGNISLSAERTDGKVDIPKTEIYADVVKHRTEGQKIPTLEFKVSSEELSKTEISALKIDKDSPNKFPTYDLTLQEHQVKAQDIEIPKVEKAVSVPKTEMGTAEIQFQKSDISFDLRSDITEPSARMTVGTVDKSEDDLEVNIKIPKLKIPRFTFKTFPNEAYVSVSKLITDPKITSSDIEVVQVEASSTTPETPEALEGGIQKAKSKILMLSEPDIKTAQMSATIDSSVNVGQGIHWSYLAGQEIHEKVEPEHVAIERCEIYSTQILKESEILSSEVKTATLGFSLLKVKLPESHSNLDVLVQQSSAEYKTDVSVGKSDESVGAPAQRTGSEEVKISEKTHIETEECSGSVSVGVGLPKLETFAVEVKPSSKPEDSHPDKSSERKTVAPLSKDDDVAEALDDEENGIIDQKEKTDSKRSPGRFKFWLPNIGFSSSSDETSSDLKTEVKKTVPEDTKPTNTLESDYSKQTEKTGWFRFPKLGFTSPSKKAKTVDKEEETGHKDRRSSDEDSPSDKPDIFFDAQESLSPKETITESEKNEIIGTSSNVPVSRNIVTSSARTELILLEEEK